MLRIFNCRKMLVFAVLIMPAQAAFAAPPSITVSKPWMRYLLPSIPAAGYMVVQNTGDTVAVLTGAASPACSMLMLHESQVDSGMAMMMTMPTITVPAHGSVTFAPGGYHLMCMGPSMKPGDQVLVTLKFQGGQSISATMPVYGAQGAP